MGNFISPSFPLSWRRINFFCRLEFLLYAVPPGLFFFTSGEILLMECIQGRPWPKFNQPGWEICRSNPSRPLFARGKKAGAATYPFMAPWGSIALEGGGGGLCVDEAAAYTAPRFPWLKSYHPGWKICSLMPPLREILPIKFPLFKIYSIGYAPICMAHKISRVKILPTGFYSLCIAQ